MPSPAARDRWDSGLYEGRHSFVWKTSADLLDLLDPQPGERILDLGCGTGHLTAAIAERGAGVVGLDSSPSMIAQARQNYPNLNFVLADARNFRFESHFDAVFSNAALHWIPEASHAIESIARVLRSGGRLALEMGARGNIVRIIDAIESALRERGLTPRNPWFFPSLGEYSTLLEQRGFEVAYAVTFDRASRLEHPDRGMREWLEMFAGPWFEDMAADERSTAYAEIEGRLRSRLWHDGAWWADYKRLRLLARRC